MVSGDLPTPGDAGPVDEKKGPEMSSLIDLLMSKARTDLDEIEEPTLDDLAAMDDLDDVEEIAAPVSEPLALEAALSAFAEVEAPELVSFEGLDDAQEPVELEQDIDEVDDLLEDVEGLIEDYIDIDLEDDELDDEGYDLDDDDVGSYRDLYGEDDTITPSFREGEFAEEEEGDSAYYDDLR